MINQCLASRCLRLIDLTSEMGISFGRAETDTAAREIAKSVWGFRIGSLA